MNNMIKKRGVYETLNTFCNLKSSKGSDTFSMDTYVINDYFISVSTSDNDNDQYAQEPCGFHPFIITPSNHFTLRKISLPELIKTWKSLKKINSNCTDTTGLSPRMIQLSIGLLTLGNTY